MKSTSLTTSLWDVTAKSTGTCSISPTVMTSQRNGTLITLYGSALKDDSFNYFNLLFLVQYHSPRSPKQVTQLLSPSCNIHFCKLPPFFRLTDFFVLFQSRYLLLEIIYSLRAGTGICLNTVPGSKNFNRPILNIGIPVSYAVAHKLAGLWND